MYTYFIYICYIYTYIYQALWCLAFRDWALEYQWVPASLLTLAAVALYRAHFHSES